MKTILITGGAGFVGSTLAMQLKANTEDIRVAALDNLKRRGSELNLNRLKNNGVEFYHGDIRNIDDLMAVGKIDLIIECSAEPSVLAGYSESPVYVIHTNLNGTVNCLELARKYQSDFIFLSTSRVYPFQTISNLNYIEKDTRFELAPGQSVAGVSEKGFREDFPLDGVRSLYGATKLCSEFLIQEYQQMYGLRTVINRCGVISGPWQMGKVDQGIMVYWIARHLFGGELRYIGYGGSGRQVRDILHVNDLFDLIVRQIKGLDQFNGNIFNVGGGLNNSISLCELTEICREVTGKTILVTQASETRPADIPYYVSDISKVTTASGWIPQRSVRQTAADISRWIQDHRESLMTVLM